jgi:hypothetical protein
MAGEENRFLAAKAASEKGESRLIAKSPRIQEI